MNKSVQLFNFLSEYIENIEHQGGSGGVAKLPDFELYAFDYLEFAEKRINNINTETDTDELINCVANLKRAVDCQLDTFFYSCNLYKTVSKQNLKFETKLNFLKDIGVFNSSSLGRLNTLRNKMEHHYEIPKINDIEVYYDLVSAFVSVLQGLIYVITYNREIDFSIYNDEEEEFGSFSSEYNDIIPEIKVSWQIGENTEDVTLIAKVNELDDFAYFFKIHLLLIQLDSFATWKHIKSKIEITEKK